MASLGLDRKKWETLVGDSLVHHCGFSLSLLLEQPLGLSQARASSLGERGGIFGEGSTPFLHCCESGAIGPPTSD